MIAAIIVGSYAAVMLAGIRYSYIQLIDNNVERGKQAQASAIMLGFVWPLTLIIVGFWHLGRGLLFRETPGQRKARQEAEKHGKGVW